MEISHSRKHFDLVFDISEAHAQEALRHLTSAPVIPVAKRKNTLCSDATSTLLPNRIVQRGICLGCIAAKAQVPMVANRAATAPYKQAELYLTGMVINIYYLCVHRSIYRCTIDNIASMQMV